MLKCIVILSQAFKSYARNIINRKIKNQNVKKKQSENKKQS